MAKKTKTETAEQKLERLMVRIILTEPFFSILLMRLERKADNSIPTAGTDGKELIYNESWIESLPDDDAHFILLHEIMHCVANHTSRRGSRDHALYNEAADHAINLELISYGYKMPAEGLADPRFKGMSAEQIYTVLKSERQPGRQPQPQPQGDNQGGGNGQPSGNGDNPEPTKQPGQQGQGQGQGQGDKCPDPGKCGGVMDAPAESPADLAEHEAEWQQAVQQAAQVAKAQGKLPSGLARMLEEVLRPVVDWKDTLRDFLTRNSKDDYSWAKANRRFVHQNIYLPSMYSEGNMDFFAIAVDTSGSMSDSDMAQFAGEITSIMEDTKPPKIEVIYCDSSVGSRQTFTEADLPLQLKPVGGGGTSFAPVMKELSKLDEEPSALVYFTDGYCSEHGNDPGCPVLWVVTSDGSNSFKPKFGRVVRMQAGA